MSRPAATAAVRWNWIAKEVARRSFGKIIRRIREQFHYENPGIKGSFQIWPYKKNLRDRGPVRYFFPEFCKNCPPPHSYLCHQHGYSEKVGRLLEQGVTPIPVIAQLRIGEPTWDIGLPFHMKRHPALLERQRD